VASIGLRIDGFLDATLQNGGIKLTYEIQDAAPSDDDFETPDVMVKFSGPDVDLLLSNRAELLLALEHVTMEMLRMPSEDHSRISFDANDYRLLRIEELRLSAVAAADRVKRTGEHFRFNPMNSRERRVIHLALRHEIAVRSESCGAGPGRHVVVYPAGMASLPEPPRSLEPPRRSMYDGPRPPDDRGPGGPRGDRRDRGGRGGGRGDRGGRGGRSGPRR
jgi:spoIIIJ-associated protein